MAAPTESAGLAPEPIPLWYRIPEGFRPIDFEQPPEERFDQVVADLSELHPSATPEQIAVTALSFEASLAKLVDDGVVHFSSFLLRTDDELVSGVCQIAVVPRPPGDSHLYPLSVLESQDPPPKGTHQGLVELPAGVAAVIVAGHEMAVPGMVFGIEEDTLSRVRTVTFQLAFPYTPEAVSISFATEDLEHGDEFLELATVFAGGVSFTAPPEPPQEEELQAAQQIREDIRETFG
ncbi:hypothetical protein [Streptomyces sp. WMMB 322]|uniref:hypothetical protein n=1 Tax=Streptomyces sp. WMMB 322 TaxID=1286821 RepID=UPI0006E31EBC|nr:hypothetical protein [Streptomyces sp. WMMB 322]SCK36002.1 hypothetical protein H180DRAFT_02997 [Streptomyces sp. WMMB 322]